MRRSLEAAVEVYQRHGPLLRARRPRPPPATSRSRRELRARCASASSEFAEQALRDIAGLGRPPADLAETARALNLMNESYLLDASAASRG